MITIEDFKKIDFRSGTIISAELFLKVKKPAYKIWADFGPAIGVLQTSAQITTLYTPESLINKQIVGCINLREKNIAGFISQFLLVGFPDEQNNVCLVISDKKVPNGKKLF